ncbi:MAG: SPOR domain-containing protein [Prevotellaceae bacterium]|jgi:hypothetical protein|nr:SPOR domain-containing protein [Prevotellaceae bacterium]MDY3856358.1 SPOR domain-containing protein [Bacteroidaceae bacterium]
MIDLARYIEKLLLDHDCVIVAGLGGFVAHWEHAYVSSTDGTLYPPSRSVGYNAQLTVSDGLVAQHLMQDYDTDYSQATRMIDEAVTVVRHTLRDAGEWEIGGLGVLKLQEGKLHFVSSSEGGIATPSLYGLDCTMMEPFEQIVRRQSFKSQTIDKQRSEETVQTEKSTLHVRIQSWRRWGKYAAIIVGIVLASFAISVPVYDGATTHLQHVHQAADNVYAYPLKSIVDKAYARLHRPSSQLMQTASCDECGKQHVSHLTDNDLNENNTDKVSSETTPQISSETKQKDNYTIVLASQVKESNARYYIDQLKQKGLDKAHLFTSKRMRRVIYDNYSTEQKARKALHRLRKISQEFDAAWVMQID